KWSTQTGCDRAVPARFATSMLAIIKAFRFHLESAGSSRRIRIEGRVTQRRGRPDLDAAPISPVLERWVVLWYLDQAVRSGLGRCVHGEVANLAQTARASEHAIASPRTLLAS